MSSAALRGGDILYVARSDHWPYDAPDAPKLYRWPSFDVLARPGRRRGALPDWTYRLEGSRLALDFTPLRSGPTLYVQSDARYTGGRTFLDLGVMATLPVVNVGLAVEDSHVFNADSPTTWVTLSANAAF